MTTIAVVDYGMGNRRSVQKALEHVGARADITRDPAALEAADALVVPGVGAFPEGMRNLVALGLDEFTSGSGTRRHERAVRLKHAAAVLTVL